MPGVLFDIFTDNNFRKSVLIGETSEHADGYTLYNIILKASSSKLLYVEKSFCTPKRYKEIDKLHKQLELVHKQLYLDGTFPLLPKLSYLSRKEPGIIEERRAATEIFLNFALSDRILCKSSKMKAFFEDAKQADENSESKLDAPVLIPTDASSPKCDAQKPEFPTMQSSQSCIDTKNQEAATIHTAQNLPSDLSVFDPFGQNAEQSMVPQNSVAKDQESNVDLLSSVDFDKKSGTPPKSSSNPKDNKKEAK